MKRIICILLMVALLTTGCTFIGQKASNDDEPIIPVDVNKGGQGDDTGSAMSSNSTDTAANNSVDSSSISSPDVSGNSGELFGSGIIVDNGTGRGVTANSTDKGSILMTLYYRDKDNLLVPVTRSVTKQEGLAKAAVSGLVDEAVTREQLDYYGLYPVLPQGTKIRGMNIKNGSAVIDFSKEFMNLKTKEDEQLAVTSIIYTLTGFSTISDVAIRIEGRENSTLPNGTSLSGVRSRDNTFINSADAGPKEGYVKCDLYYMTTGNDQFIYFVPVSTQVQQASDSQLTVSIFDELGKQPEGGKYFTSVPQGTKLLSYNLQSGTAVLDFSSQLINYGGAEKENGLLNQIYYTLNQLKGIAKAKILVDGKETTLPEGTEIALAKSLPTTFNKVMDK